MLFFKCSTMNFLIYDMNNLWYESNYKHLKEKSKHFKAIRTILQVKNVLKSFKKIKRIKHSSTQYFFEITFSFKNGFLQVL